MVTIEFSLMECVEDMLLYYFNYPEVTVIFFFFYWYCLTEYFRVEYILFLLGRLIPMSAHEYHNRDSVSSQYWFFPFAVLPSYFIHCIMNFWH